MQSAGASYRTHDPENPEDLENLVDTEAKGILFSEQSIRRGFIRKVYSIVTTQLGITLAIICWFMYDGPTRTYVIDHPDLLWVTLCVIIVIIIPISCCGNLCRKAPANFIFLGIFTVILAFELGLVTAAYSTQEMIQAVGISAAICLGLTLFACQTTIGGLLVVALIMLIPFGFIAIFLPEKILELVFPSLGALVFCVYIVVDIQLMMGGKHMYIIDPEEYIFASLNLYLDVTCLFAYMTLKLIHKLRKK